MVWLIRKAREFGAEQNGMALILVSIMLPVIVGFALLAIDMSRANNLHNDVQKGADAFALAAAAELDGASDAWVRAERALENLVDNTTQFSTGGRLTLTTAGAATVNTTYAACRSRGDISWCFLKSIPASDASPIDPATNYAANAGETRFIVVAVNPENFSAIFPASFLGGSDGFQVGASAVAGFTRSICDQVPMFMCNPFETTDVSTNKSIVQAFNTGDTYSREFRILKTDSTPGPGNFGLLQTEMALREAFAKGTAGGCYARNSVDTKTGVTLGHVNSGLNVRFDIYSGTMKSHDTDPAYRPASNVRKGADKPDQCNKFEEADPTMAMGFPEGDNYAAGKTDKTWNRSAYWTLNHGGTMPSIASTSHPTSTSELPSRYDVYRYEIANNLVGDKARGDSKGETGIPGCYKGTGVSADPDRRLMTMAVVNCLSTTGLNGHVTLRPDAYVRVFLTNPITKVDKTKDDDDTNAAEKPIRFEIVDVEGPLGNDTLDDTLRDEVQLYR